MSAIALATVVVGAGAAAVSADSSRKAIHAQQDAAKAGKADIDQLNAQTVALSKQNAIDSAALEKQLTPEVASLRTGANQQLLAGLGKTDPNVERAKGMLGQNLGVPLNTPLLNAAIAKAQSDLALGGNLSQDVQNSATRKALATAGSVGGGGLGLGRDLVARDLGLTSMQVAQQRLQNASQLGGQELDLGTANSTNFLNQLNILRAINDSQFGQNMSLAQYAQGIAQPIVGLDPGSAANLAMGNANGASAALANSANIRGQQSQNYANLAGQALGYGLLQYNNRPATSGITPASSPTGYTTPGGNVGVQTSGFFS